MKIYIIHIFDVGVELGNVAGVANYTCAKLPYNIMGLLGRG